MIPLNTVFWGLVFFFGLIGALRGWAKEVLVSFSVLLALFIQQVFGHYVLDGQSAYLPVLLSDSNIAVPATYSTDQFYVCVTLLLALTFFGYASPTLAAQTLGTRVRRERIQEAVLGFFLGLVNGYLILGTLWFYLHKVGYKVGGITTPLEGTSALTFATTYLLPLWLSVPLLYVSVALAFVFVIIVFV